MRTRTTAEPIGPEAEARRRRPVADHLAILAAAVVGGIGYLSHTFTNPAGPDLVGTASIPLLAYLALTLSAFHPRLRSMLTWALMICAWTVVVISLVGSVPCLASPSTENIGVHVVVHLAMMCAQIPLIVMLVRRLSRPFLIG